MARAVIGLCTSLSRLDGLEIRILTQGISSKPIFRGKFDENRLLIATSDSKYTMQTGYLFKRFLINEIEKNRPDILHDNGLWLPANHIVANVARNYGIPYALHPHGMMEPWSMQYRSIKKKFAWMLYQKRNLNSVTAFFATSTAEARHIRELGFKQPISVVPNGVDGPPNGILEPPKKEKNRVRHAVFMSRIHPKKGLMNLLLAWSMEKRYGWKLILAGPDEGGHLAEVLNRANDLGLSEDIEYRGVVDGDSKDRLLREADLFVLPSFSENFGVVIAEALAYGIPVISTMGTPWQGLVENKCGWWVSAEVEALAAALKEAMTLNDQERHKMAIRAQKYSREFNWNQIASEIADVYRWLLGLADRPGSVRLD
ncbi:glycosyltransferase [Pseudomonadota bacterium]